MLAEKASKGGLEGLDGVCFSRLRSLSISAGEKRRTTSKGFCTTLYVNGTFVYSSRPAYVFAGLQETVNTGSAENRSGQT